MADVADNSDDKINAVVDIGRARAENAKKLQPIIYEEDKKRWGVCHWCESPITPGQLFCRKDPQDTGMCCSESWDHDHKRRKDLGL